LERFQGEFVKLEGYNNVLKNVHNTENEIKNHTEELHRPEIENLKLSMKVWKQRLNYYFFIEVCLYTNIIINFTKRNLNLNFKKLEE